MELTEELVEKIARFSEEISGGAFPLMETLESGDGVRWEKIPLTWKGSAAAEYESPPLTSDDDQSMSAAEAAARRYKGSALVHAAVFYLGVISAHRLSDNTPGLKEMLRYEAALITRRGTIRWWDEGWNRAEQHIKQKAAETAA